MGWTDKVKKFFGSGKDAGTKSYSVQLLVGDDGFMVAQSFNGSDLSTVYTQAIWTYICANRISQDIASFPAIVQARKPHTDRWEKDLDHPLNEILERPYGKSDLAPRVDWQQQIATGVLRQEITGNQFYQKVVAGDRLLALALFMVQLKANEDPTTRLFNSYTPEGGSTVIPVDNVVNILHANPGSTWEGVSPGGANEQAARVNYSADRRNRYDLETRVAPGVVFKVKSLFTLTKDQKDEAEEWLTDQYEGATKAGKSLIIGDNIDIQGGPVNVVDDIPTKDKNARDKVISSYDISPPMVGVLDAVKYTNLDKAMRIQFSNCIGPRLLKIYGPINTQGVWPVYGRDVRIWFDMVQSPLGLAHLAERGEIASVYQGLGWPAMHLNERFALEMGEFEGWDKANMSAVVAGRVPGEGSGDPDPGDDPEPDDDETEGDDE